MKLEKVIDSQWDYEGNMFKFVVSIVPDDSRFVLGHLQDKWS